MTAKTGAIPPKVRKVRKVSLVLTFGTPCHPPRAPILHPDRDDDPDRDMMTSAIMALAYARAPKAEADRTIAAALAIMALPAETLEAEVRRHFLLETLMGFGRFGKAEGSA